MPSVECSGAQREANAMAGKGGWRGQLVLAGALAGFALVAAGCTGESAELAVVVRPFAPPHEAAADLEAEIDGDARQVIVAPERVNFRNGRTAVRAGGQRVTFYSVPASWNGRAVAVMREIRGAGGARHESLPPLILRVQNGTLKVPQPRREAARINASGVLLRAAPQTHTSAPFHVPPGAALEGSLGLSPVVPRDESVPVRIRIVASLGEGDTKPLLEEVLDAKSDGNAWHDYRIDLHELAGREVRLAVSVEPSSSSAKNGFALPLISSPLLVAPEKRALPNFVVISLDTLRADHVGVYGSREPTTPNLDRFAESAVTFRDAMTTFPSTTASHMSLFTGLYPSAHRVFEPGPRLKAKAPTLTSILARNGYRTGAITENGMLMRSVGFGRGFDTYLELRKPEPLDTPGFVAEGVDQAEEWLGRYGGERFFLFLHTYQVHAPYEPPEEYDRFRHAGTASQPRRAAYAGEVLYTDHEIGRFLEFLDNSGLSHNTVVLITSDHGESFGEHGRLGHGSALFEEELQVPLLLRAPGRSQAGLQVETPVSLVDIAPTLLELAGIDAPAAMQGKSLARLSAGIDDDEVRDRALYAQRRLEGDRYVVAIRRGKEKWLSGTLNADANVVDLATDPHEESPRTSEDIRIQANRLRAAYRAEGDALFASFGEDGAPVHLDAETRDRLRALGYVDAAESDAP